MKLPDKIFGISTEEAYKKYLEDSKKKPETEEPKTTSTIMTPTSRKIANPESYVMLEGRTHGSYSSPDLLVPMERSHFNTNWNQTHQALQQEGSYMLTIRQFVDFFNLLKSGKAFDGKGNRLSKGTLDKILDEIVAVRSPVRSEWLDAKFDAKGLLKGRKFYIVYHKIKSDGSLEIAEEPLEDTLMQDKTPGIDLADWLSRANKQGLPPSDVKSGNLWYWHPKNGRFEGFDADSGRAGLGCSEDPSSSYPTLGVRAAKLK